MQILGRIRKSTDAFPPVPCVYVFAAPMLPNSSLKLEKRNKATHSHYKHEGTCHRLSQHQHFHILPKTQTAPHDRSVWTHTDSLAGLGKGESLRRSSVDVGLGVVRAVAVAGAGLVVDGRHGGSVQAESHNARDRDGQRWTGLSIYLSFLAQVTDMDVDLRRRMNESMPIYLRRVIRVRRGHGLARGWLAAVKR